MMCIEGNAQALATALAAGPLLDQSGWVITLLQYYNHYKEPA